jgi:hypothetical protein
MITVAIECALWAVPPGDAQQPLARKDAQSTQARGGCGGTIRDSRRQGICAENDNACDLQRTGPLGISDHIVAVSKQLPHDLQPATPGRILAQSFRRCPIAPFHCDLASGEQVLNGRAARCTAHVERDRFALRSRQDDCVTLARLRSRPAVVVRCGRVARRVWRLLCLRGGDRSKGGSTP